MVDAVASCAVDDAVASVCARARGALGGVRRTSGGSAAGAMYFPLCPLGCLGDAGCNLSAHASALRKEGAVRPQ